jgi:hypothetical protein
MSEELYTVFESALRIVNYVKISPLRAFRGRLFEKLYMTKWRQIIWQSDSVVIAMTLMMKIYVTIKSVIDTGLFGRYF